MKSPVATPSDTYSSTLRQFEREVVKPNPGRTLMVGSCIYGPKKTRHELFPDLLGVDMLPGPGVDVVADLEEPQDFGLFDHVECTSVLEHAKRPWLLAANIERLMKPGASIYVSVPFAWRIHGYPSDYWRMTTEAVRLLFPSIEWVSLMYADTKLHDKARIPAAMVEGHYHLARSEACGFGFKR